MSVNVVSCLIFLLGLLFSSGLAKESEDDQSFSPSLMQKAKSNKESILLKPIVYEPERQSNRNLHTRNKLQSSRTVREMDVVTPLTTVPMINPTTTPTTVTPNYNPFPTTSTPSMTPTTNPYSTPTMATPSSPSGQSWCVASQTASQTELQVALDYACGYGSADCSAIQQGGSCYNPDTVRDHASYAFNDYYQRNPIPTSCDFGGTAVITNVDPSTSTCQYPSTCTSSSVLNTTYPTGSTLFGSVPPATSGSTLMLNSITPPIIVICLLMSLIFLSVTR
ncbi:unnamed protein product [Musa hybrid cultivar]